MTEEEGDQGRVVELRSGLFKEVGFYFRYKGGMVGPFETYRDALERWHSSMEDDDGR